MAGKTTFTAKQLEEALNKVTTADTDFPDYPILCGLDSYSLWDEASYPLILRKVGEDKNVTVRCKEYFGGEEGGDHAMFIILSVSWGEDERFFKKNGEYDSWDSSEWDGPLYEAVATEVTRTEWVMKPKAKA